MLEHFVRPEHRDWDNGTWKEVVADDCYHIRDRNWGAKDVVIDVGANIGLFSGMALARGAGFVICVEPSPENYRRLTANLAPWGAKVQALNCAVWRSDQPQRKLRLTENMPDGNTGGINVLANVGEIEIPTVALDDLIGDRQITFLKVDCEGSEFPILYTSRRLRQVAEVMVEVHPVGHLIQPDADVRPGRNDPFSLAGYLSEQGFQVVNHPREGMPEGWAYLHGTR